jgi:hypothetical protein
MINTMEGFTMTATVADGFSDLIFTLYDREAGIHARSAIGVPALPIKSSSYYIIYPIRLGIYWHTKNMIRK